MNKIKHYIIIRFYNENFGVIPLEQMLDFNFLNDVGVKLLNNNCLKSLENQTNKDFEVINTKNDIRKSENRERKLVKRHPAYSPTQNVPMEKASTVKIISKPVKRIVIASKVNII